MAAFGRYGRGGGAPTPILANHGYTPDPTDPYEDEYMMPGETFSQIPWPWRWRQWRRDRRRQAMEAEQEDKDKGKIAGVQVAVLVQMPNGNNEEYELGLAQVPWNES